MCGYKTSHSAKHVLTIFVTETNLMLSLSLVINSIRHLKQHKLTVYQTNSANNDTVVVPLSINFYTVSS